MAPPSHPRRFTYPGSLMEMPVGAALSDRLLRLRPKRRQEIVDFLLRELVSNEIFVAKGYGQASMNRLKVIKTRLGWLGVSPEQISASAGPQLEEYFAAERERHTPTASADPQAPQLDSLSSLPPASEANLTVNPDRIER